MGACLSSGLGKLGEGEGDVVALCRERKRFMKSVIENRYAFADAHYRYMLSLKAMADACRLFVSSHLSPSPLYIALPQLPSSSPPCTPPSVPRLSLHCHSSPSSSSSSSSPPPSYSPEISAPVPTGETAVRFQAQQTMPGLGWDFFFNPFDDFGAKVESVSGCSDEDLRIVREEEGIPELEEVDDDDDDDNGVCCIDDKETSDCSIDDKETSDDEIDEKTVAFGNGSKEGEENQSGLTVVDTPSPARELLDALKEIEDHFIRAYDSGKEVCRMLEANKVQLFTGIEEIKENSSKLIHAIAWHRSSSSSQCSSSRRSFLSSTDFDSTWKSFSNDLFYECGMISGSHSLTLDRLLAWEKKLYDEVKAGDNTRRLYEQKCLQLHNQETRVDDLRAIDKTRAAVKDLYTRILVALRAAESISTRIHKLRDEELQPQIAELLEGLRNCWSVMLESHETQYQLMLEVKSFTRSSAGRFCSDSHRNATQHLENQLHNWRSCFTAWISTQKDYVQSLNGWLSKFIAPEVEFFSKETSFPYKLGAPPVSLTFQKWLSSLDNLPQRSVSYSIRNFCRDIKALKAQQGEEQKQKRKVENLAKELQRRVLALQKVEKRILESKLSDTKQGDVGHRVDYLIGRKDLIDMDKRRLDLEKEKHHKCMEETQHITLRGFQTGSTSMFQSLTEFSRASSKLYEDLVVFHKKVNMTQDDENRCIEGSNLDVDTAD